VEGIPPLPEGITVGNLLRSFGNRVGRRNEPPAPGQMPQSEWLNVVRGNSVYNNTEKLLRRKA
jgi:hypothetical protein